MQGDYSMTWGGDGVHGSVQEGAMQGSTCDAMQGCVGSTEDEASSWAIRHDMRGRSRWSPALVACCLLSVDRRHVHGQIGRAHV